ncbi:TPR repeat [Acinetobacter marinus]|uniref:TPR repeat n=1 Tax=Acinetobacter marinus TaxID=281375 RepID=A0A1G6HIW9_9GAMM|nr:SEL1-like repeat protein [Acinetobacter marinus]SDB94192.1 TPR repeat [Acinetobacter marinus]
MTKSTPQIENKNNVTGNSAQQSQSAFEQQLRQKAQQGDGVACFQLVEHFEHKAPAQNKLESQNRINLLMQASNQGVGAASILLGRWYLTGHYVAKDSAKAIMFFEHAGNVCKDSYGFYQLAEMFQTGKGVSVNAEKGLDYLKKAVAMNNPEAIFTYANQLLKTDVAQAFQLLKDNYKKQKHLKSLLFINDAQQLDQDKVQQYLKEHAEQDSFASALYAFRLLQAGDAKQAIAYAERAIKDNNPIAFYVRALIELQDDKGDAQKAQQYMLQAAQFGHVEAAYRAGMTCLQQVDQLPDEASKKQMLQQSLQLLAQAAQSGFDAAQFSLGQCWLQGIGVEKNPKEGMAWIERAAQQGNIDATFALALNLPVEHEQHLPLLKHAAEQGHTKAMICMGIYAQNHEQAEKGLEWFELAKSRGEIRADYMLAVAYRDGLGVEADSAKAIELFKTAADNGDADAMYALYQAYRDGEGVRKNKKSQAKYLDMAKTAQHPDALKISE